MTPVSCGKQCAGNLHTQMEERASAPANPKQNALLQKKVYVAFDYANSIDYYNAIKLWFSEENGTYSLTDSNGVKLHAASKTPEIIQGEVEDRMRDAYVIFFLVNESTRYPFKYFLWEREVAIRLNKPIFVINLNGARVPDGMCCPDMLMKTLALHMPFNQKIVMYALERWVVDSARFQNYKQPFFYSEKLYSKLDL